jgi:hypothetical protein
MYMQEVGRTFGEVKSSEPLTKERVEQVVNAIYRLPEGTSAKGMRDYSYERRIVEKLRRQGFSETEIKAGLLLTRKELGLPDPPRVDLTPRSGHPRIGPPLYSKEQYDRWYAEHLDRLYRRAAMGDVNAAKSLSDALEQILNDRARLATIRRELTELRSPAAIMLRVRPEPPAPTPSPPRRWWLPPRPMIRR